MLELITSRHSAVKWSNTATKDGFFVVLLGNALDKSCCQFGDAILKYSDGSVKLLDVWLSFATEMLALWYNKQCCTKASNFGRGK